MRRGELTRASSVGMVQISPGTFWSPGYCTHRYAQGRQHERFFVRCTFLHITIAYDNIAGSTYIVSLTYHSVSGQTEAKPSLQIFNCAIRGARLCEGDSQAFYSSEQDDALK
jgi:hypothetical protein